MFEALYQQQPPDVIDTEFPSEYFADAVWFVDYPPDQEIICRATYVDPSLGKTDKSDYSAIVNVCLDNSGRYWVDADLRRRPATQVVYDAIEGYQANRSVCLGCEVNAFQELLGVQMQDEAQRRGLDCFFVGLVNTISKLVRIRQLTPLLAAGRLRFKRNSPGVNLLMEQLRGFPAHKHDDGPDALEGAVRLCQRITSGEVSLEA
jgi:predicted phage terminase large subunit-like protein